jgi:hypothetical protein
VSNLQGDIIEDIVVSLLSLQNNVHFQPLLRYILAYKCAQFYMPGHIKINLHSLEIQKSSRPMYVENVCKHLADDTKFT